MILRNKTLKLFFNILICFLISINIVKANIYEEIKSNTWIKKASIKTKIPYLDIVPSGINLSGIEFELSDDRNRNKKLYSKINIYV